MIKEKGKKENIILLYNILLSLKKYNVMNYSYDEYTIRYGCSKIFV